MKTNLCFGLLFLSLFFSIGEKTNAQAPGWLWAKSIGGTDGEDGSSIAIDPAGSGDVYTTANFFGTIDFDPGPGIFNLTGGGMAISKLDGFGNFVWAKALGGEAGTGGGAVFSIVVDAAGNGDVYTTGGFYGTADFDPGAGTFNLTANGGGYNIFISKLDASGNFVWAKALIGAGGGGEGHSIAVDPSGSGDIYIAGNSFGTVDFDPGPETFNITGDGNFIVKLDSLGNFEWAKRPGGSSPYLDRSIAVDLSGNVYITGSFYGTVDFDPDSSETFNLTTSGSNDIFISKLDGSGSFVWAKAIGGIENDDGGSIALDLAGSGDVYTTGSFYGTVDFDPDSLGIFNLTSFAFNDIFISKVDSSGDFVWARAMGGIDGDIGQSIAVDPSGSGDVYTTGYFWRTVDFDPGLGNFNLTSVNDTMDIFISKLDGAGHFVWAKSMGGISYDISQSITLDPAGSGNLYVVGRFNSITLSLDSITLTNADGFGLSSDIFIAKLNVLSTAVDNVGTRTQDITLYPNPATDQLTINAANDILLVADITMYNILGEVVLYRTDANITHALTIDISALATGIYFVELDIEGIREMKKVIIE